MPSCVMHSASGLFRSCCWYCHLSFVTSGALSCLDCSGVTWNLTVHHKLTRLLSPQLSRVLRLLKYPAEDSENPPQVNFYYCMLTCWMCCIYYVMLQTDVDAWLLRELWNRSHTLNEGWAVHWCVVTVLETSVYTAGINMPFASLGSFSPLKP